MLTVLWVLLQSETHTHTHSHSSHTAGLDLGKANRMTHRPNFFANQILCVLLGVWLWSFIEHTMLFQLCCILFCIEISKNIKELSHLKNKTKQERKEVFKKSGKNNQDCPTNRFCSHLLQRHKNNQGCPTNRFCSHLLQRHKNNQGCPTNRYCSHLLQRHQFAESYGQQQ